MRTHYAAGQAVRIESVEVHAQREDAKCAENLETERDRIETGSRCELVRPPRPGRSSGACEDRGKYRDTVKLVEELTPVAINERWLQEELPTRVNKDTAV